MGSLLLGVDIGTYSAKGVLCTPGGEVLRTAIVEHTMDVPHPGWAEQDADRVWWGGFTAICRQLLAGGYRGSDIGAVGVSAIGPCMLPVDSHGRPLRPGVLYGVDTRASAQIEALNREIGEDAIFALSGQALSSQTMGPKMRWFRETEPELFARAKHILSASSYLIFKLTGEYVINRHEAPYSAPLIDIQRLEYDGRYEEQVVPLSLLPRLAWSTEIAGLVTKETAAETGLAPGTPVSAGTVDAAAEATSVGVVNPGDLMIMYGSTMYLLLITERPNPHRLVWTTGYNFPGSYDIGLGMATTGALTRWFRDEFAGAETAVENAGGKSAYAALAEQATVIPAGSDGLICLPYFSGERTPINDPDARGVFAGLTLGHTREHLYRALLEGTAYGTRHNLETIEAIGGTVRRVVAVGGGVNNALWLQIVSSAIGLEQIVPERSIGASLGDAFLAGIAAGIIPAIGVLHRDWVKTGTIVTPDPVERAVYDRYYPIYRSLYEESKSSIHALARLARHRSMA